MKVGLLGFFRGGGGILIRKAHGIRVRVVVIFGDKLEGIMLVKSVQFRATINI